MKRLNVYFGMPRDILTYLSVLAAAFCLYSATCYFTVKHRHARFLRLIGIVNILYCVLTIGLVVVYYKVLTYLAIIYFLAEAVVVCALAYVELKTASAQAV